MPLRFLTSGESHGPAFLAILEGMPAGLALDAEMINHDLARRQRGFGSGPRMKLEHDIVHIQSGVMAGETIGSPIALWIENRDHAKWRRRPVSPFTTPRPGHADLNASLKYAYRDVRPALERASARETVARVAIGAVCRRLLAKFGIEVGGYVRSIGEVSADLEGIPLQERIRLASLSDVGCPDPQAADAMHARIDRIMLERDTLGGVIEVAVLGLPIGLGSHVHWDRRLDARVGAAVLGIQAIKGVEIGPAFENTRAPGTQVHDPIRLENGAITRTSNRSGGLEGGITTGQPLVIRAAMKPIATTLNPLPTVDLARGVEVPTKYERSDYCPVPRAVVIVESMIAYVLADALIEKLGGDSLAEMVLRYAVLPGADIKHLPMDGFDHVWWPE